MTILGWKTFEIKLFRFDIFVKKKRSKHYICNLTNIISSVSHICFLLLFLKIFLSVFVSFSCISFPFLLSGFFLIFLCSSYYFTLPFFFLSFVLLFYIYQMFYFSFMFSSINNSNSHLFLPSYIYIFFSQKLHQGKRII